MTTTTTKEKQSVYSLGKKEDKHFFAAFLNLAVNNVENAFDEFAKQLGVSNINKKGKRYKPEESIQKFFKPDLSLTDWEKHVEILEKYFPLVSYLKGNVTDNNEKDDKSKILKRDFSSHEERKKAFSNYLTYLVKALVDLRNHYTHYYHDPISFKPDNETFYKFMDELFVLVIKDVRKRKKKSDKTKEALKEELEIEFVERMKDKSTALKKMDKEAGKRVKNRSQEELRNAVMNDAFKHLIVKNNDKYTLTERYQAFPEKLDSPISEKSLLFLCSCFLSRRDMELFKSRIKGFKAKMVEGEDNLKYMATHWVYIHLNFKGLKRKINTHFEKENLLSQIVDDLSKVPDCVYQVVKDKNEFLLDINKFYKQTKGEAESPEKEEVVNPIIRKRFEDKFNYFALRYLDEFAGFDNLKFQVHAGNYLHSRMEKKSNQTQLKTDRKIKERINVFGKLSDVNKAKANFFANKTDDSDMDEGWEEYPNPSYNINVGSILIYLNLKKFGYENEAKEILTHREKAKGREKRIANGQIYSQVFSEKNGVSSKAPTALLSLNELPALLYGLLVNKKSPADIEQIIADKIVSHYRKIKDFEGTAEDLKDKNLPINLRKAVGVDDKNTDKLENAITKDIETGEDKLKLIKDNTREVRSNKRKYVFYLKEKGEEATWLANDIKRFMPENAKNKWKSYNHNELQKGLAYYEFERKNVLALLESKWDMDSCNPHWGEDLKMLFIKHRRFEDFYKAYMLCRQKVLEQFKTLVVRHKSDKKLLNKVLKDVFIPYKERFFVINSLKNEKKALLSHPIVLPRGLFDDKPTFIKGVSLENDPSRFANWFAYVRKEAKNDHQVFYDFERDYEKAFSVLKDKSKYNNDKHFNFKVDSAIRMCMQNDIVLKLITKELFKGIFDVDENIKLNDFYLEKNEVAKQREQALEQNKRLKGDDSDVIYKEDHLFRKTFAKDFLDGKLHYDKLKLKDFGKAQEFAADKKVETIVSYSGKPWTAETLQNELYTKSDSYERIRQDEFFKKIHELEDPIWQKHKHEREVLQDNGNQNFKNYIKEGVLQMLGKALVDEFESLIKKKEIEIIQEVRNCNQVVQKAYCLVQLRNRFSHNQLPPKEFFNFMTETLAEKDENKTYSRYFMDVTNKIVQEFKPLV